jgi:hypothetical protein
MGTREAKSGAESETNLFHFAMVSLVQENNDVWTIDLPVNHHASTAARQPPNRNPRISWHGHLAIAFPMRKRATIAPVVQERCAFPSCVLSWMRPSCDGPWKL